MSRPTAFFPLLCLSIVSFLAVPDASACSAFLHKTAKGIFMGKSYDWHNGEGLLLINKRRVRKTALLAPGAYRPAQWTSRYGSLTFNQYGRENPLGGINEKGLAIEILWLRSTRDGKLSTKRPTLNELQWIQYHLDTSATLPEMIVSARRVQIARIHAPVHYFACDAQARCATFELLEGKLVIHHGKTLPVPALTNSTYSQSLRYFRRKGGFNAKSKAPTHQGSLARFFRVGANTRRFTSRNDKLDGTARSFNILHKVRMGSYSQWNIVYDLRRRHLSFRNAHGEAWRTIKLAGLSFNCRTPIQAIDIRGTLGKAKAMVWQPYSTALNTKLVQRSLRQLTRGNTNRLFPTIFTTLVTQYPHTTQCLSKK